ncbi:MAG: SRPBCC family protein [Gemmatimonadales bacterium]
MPITTEFKAEARGERDIVVTRSFNAPRELVFEALTTPALLKQWLGVFNGWTLPECEMDLRVGGRYRYLWRGPAGEPMGLTGTIREFKAPERIVSSERFDDPWYPGEAITVFSLAERSGRTTLTLTITYENRDARDSVMKIGMATGLAASYDALEQVLAARGTH